MRRVLDLQDKRPQLERAVLDALIPEARNAGVSIRGGFSDPSSRELLLTRKREQLAQQMIRLQKEQQAEERIRTEKARTTAEQQPGWYGRKSGRGGPAGSHGSAIARRGRKLRFAGNRHRPKQVQANVLGGS